MQHALKVIEFDALRQKLSGFAECVAARQELSQIVPEFGMPEVGRQKRLETAQAIDLVGQVSLPYLGRFGDIAREVRLAQKGGILDCEQLWSITESIVLMSKLAHATQGKGEVFPALEPLFLGLPNVSALASKLESSVDPSGELLDSASPELNRLRKQCSKLSKQISDKAQSFTGGSYRELLSDPIVTQRGGRYVVPVKSEYRHKIKGLVHDTSSSGQTVFVEPMELVELGNTLRQAEAGVKAEEERILRDLSERIGAEAEKLLPGIESTVQLDMILARVRYGFAEDAGLAEEGPEATFDIEMGRHPLLERESAVPLTIFLGGEDCGLLITGPNTGGKTVAMKTVGLYLCMHELGMMVPARRAVLGHFTQLWADIGDEQSLQQSLSTFSGHIRNIGEALRDLKPGGLVLLDEVGAGTDPAEGEALAKAILRTIQAKGGKVLASTHFGALKVFASSHDGFQNCSMEFDLKSLRPTYRLLLGTPGSSHALKIAERVGLPKQVIELAEQHTDDAERDLSKTIESLEIAQKRAHKAQSEADRLAHRLRQVEAEALQKAEEADAARRKARREAADELESELRKIRLEVASALDALKGKPSEAEVQQLRHKLKTATQQGEQLAQRLRPTKSRPTDEVIRKGSNVRVQGYSQTGVVLSEPNDGKAQIQVGPLKMVVKLSNLELVASSAEPPKRAAKKNYALEKSSTSSSEIQLIGMRAELAEEKLVKYLDDSMLAGLSQVRIVHGKGDGILREMCREVLSNMDGVRGFREGTTEEGGYGVTIATLG